LAIGAVAGYPYENDTSVVEVSCVNETGCCWVYNNSCAVHCMNASK